MSIEQTDIVDIISTDRATGDVVLTISDHLDWSDIIALHIRCSFRVVKSWRAWPTTVRRTTADVPPFAPPFSPTVTPGFSKR